MEIKEIITYIVFAGLGLVGWFFKRELDKIQKQFESNNEIFRDHNTRINENENAIIRLEAIEKQLDRIESKL